MYYFKNHDPNYAPVERTKPPTHRLSEAFVQKKRSRADSNRCKWFCRPPPKPLGHETNIFRMQN